MGNAIVATAHVPDVSALIEQLKNLQCGEPSYYLLQRANKITDWEKGTPDAAKIEKVYARQIIWEQMERSAGKRVRVAMHCFGYPKEISPKDLSLMTNGRYVRAAK